MAALTMSSFTSLGYKSDLDHSDRAHREKKLLAAAKCGDVAAFNDLFQPLAKRTFQIVYRITKNREDAEDVLQESFLRALLHVKDFESRSRFSTWLTSIAINLALMILRKRRNSSQTLTDGSGDSETIGRHPEVADRAPNPENHYLQQERERILRGAIRGLRPGIRGVLEMQRLEEHSIEETARMMGISVAAVKGRLFHAKVALRKAPNLKIVGGTTLNYRRT